jgi:hypothetical protein
MLAKHIVKKFVKVIEKFIQDAIINPMAF